MHYHLPTCAVLGDLAGGLEPTLEAVDAKLAAAADEAARAKITEQRGALAAAGVALKAVLETENDTRAAAIKAWRVRVG